jgi:hypothetical protein
MDASGFYDALIEEYHLIAGGWEQELRASDVRRAGYLQRRRFPLRRGLRWSQHLGGELWQ